MAVALATIDEGSEINCLDYGFASKNKIPFVPTQCVAIAAVSSSICLAVETKDVVSAQDMHTAEPIELDFGKMVIVKNLGVDFLIGEPGKVDNRILTLPHRQMVQIQPKNGKKRSHILSSLPLVRYPISLANQMRTGLFIPTNRYQ